MYLLYEAEMSAIEEVAGLVILRGIGCFWGSVI